MLAPETALPGYRRWVCQVLGGKNVRNVNHNTQQGGVRTVPVFRENAVLDAAASASARYLLNVIPVQPCADVHWVNDNQPAR